MSKREDLDNVYQEIENNIRSLDLERIKDQNKIALTNTKQTIIRQGIELLTSIKTSHVTLDNDISDIVNKKLKEFVGALELP